MLIIIFWSASGTSPEPWTALAGQSVNQCAVSQLISERVSQRVSQSGLTRGLRGLTAARDHLVHIWDSGC